LGQNVNSYRSDIDFPTLLSEIAEIDGDFLIRFMTSHPKDASLKLIEVMRKYKGKIAPFFHLPLQSGSDTILKSMNRTYNRERYLSVVSALREAIPDIVLSTDVIIGFPGETDEDFAATMDILKRVRFDNVYSFLYSPREGTRAAKMTNTVPEEVKNERMKELLSAQDEIALERNLLYVGKTERVLVESVSKKGSAFTSRTAGGKLVHFTSDKCEIGDFINVKITRAGAYELFAEEVN
jgi:tRNA-2-methylthio-N6-dimethylallyladenosine synthase